MVDLSNNILIIGCCRQRFIDSKYNFIINEIGHTHSTKEIITLLQYMNNDLKISNSDTKYVFQKPMINKKNLLYSNLFKNYINKTNTFLIEIGSMKTYKYKDFYVHHVLYDNPLQLEIKNDIKENIVKTIQSYDEIEKDIYKIQNILKDKKIIIVTHITPPINEIINTNIHNCESSNSRLKLINYLKIICSKLKITLIDPTHEITIRGYNISDLVQKNDNYLHYNELGEKIMRNIYKEYLFI